MTITLSLTPEQTAHTLQAAQEQAAAIADASTPIAKSNQFVFFAAFDGTNNSADPREAGDTQTTAVRALYEQVYARQTKESNSSAMYYPGVGTNGTLPGSDGTVPDAVTKQSILTANSAYNDFAAQADTWVSQHPGGEVTSMVTGFSRGDAAAAIFSQKLYEEGLVTQDGRTLIPPGKDGAVSTALILDPVLTGETGNMNFPPSVRNITVVQAQDEHRSFFEGADYEKNPNVKVLPATGNHCDIGDAYDNGLGGIYLQAYTDHFRKAGLDIAQPDPSRQYDPSRPVAILSESEAPPGVTLPAYDMLTDPEKNRLTQPAGDPVTVTGSATRFTEYNGDTVLGGTGSQSGQSRNTIVVLPDAQAQVTGYGDRIKVDDNASVTFHSTAGATADGQPLSTASGQPVYQSGSDNTVTVGDHASLAVSGGNNTIVVSGKNDSIQMEPGSFANVSSSQNLTPTQVTINGKPIEIDPSILYGVRGVAGSGADVSSNPTVSNPSVCVSSPQAGEQCR